jgi:hypothetical protein
MMKKKYYHTKENLREIFKDYFDLITIDNYKEFEESDSLLLIGKKRISLQ